MKTKDKVPCVLVGEDVARRVHQLEAENARLRKALNSLANEASGFLHCAYAVQHGVTNMRVFQLRIDEARAALRKHGRGEDVAEFQARAMAGDYNNLVAVALEYTREPTGDDAA